MFWDKNLFLFWNLYSKVMAKVDTTFGRCGGIDVFAIPPVPAKTTENPRNGMGFERGGHEDLKNIFLSSLRCFLVEIWAFQIVIISKLSRD